MDRLFEEGVLVNPSLDILRKHQIDWLLLPTWRKMEKNLAALIGWSDWRS